MEQTLIVVDENDTVRGYASRPICHQGAGLLHRAVVVALLDPQGRLLLQRRRSELWDGYWDVTGATHPLHGVDDESYEAAASRCLRDEWGLAAQPRVVGAFRYFAPLDDRCEHEHCVVLVARHAGSVWPNPAHAYDMRWDPIVEVRAEMARDPEAFTPWAREAIGLL